MTDPATVETASYTGPDRRRWRPRLVESILREPVSAVFLGIVLGLFAWGILSTNARSDRLLSEVKANTESSKFVADFVKDCVLAPPPRPRCPVQFTTTTTR